MTGKLQLVLFATASLFMTLLLTNGGTVHAADLKVLSPQIMKSALDEILSRFEHQSGHRVTVSYATTSDQIEKIESGAVADLAILSPDQIDELQDDNRIVKSSSVSIAKIEFGVIVRKGARKPDVSTVHALKTALMNAKSIAAGAPETSSTGEYFDNLIQRLLIADEIRSKTKLYSSGTEAVQAVANGEAEISVGVVSGGIEPGTEFAGALPAQAKKTNTYAVAILASSSQTQATKTLVSFISSPASLEVFKSKGFAAP